MNSTGRTFSYRITLLPDATRLDVRGLVAADEAEAVCEAIDRLAANRCGGLILGLSQADVSPDLVAVLRERAVAALPDGRVAVDVPVGPPAVAYAS